MGSSAANTDRQSASSEPTLAKPLAPEDVRIGDYVAVLDWTYEAPSFLWCCSDDWQNDDDVVRVRLLPLSEHLTPLRVEAACLPFVLVATPNGQCRTLDLRQVRFARLDLKYGRQAWKKLRPGKPQSKRKRR
ncbi:MAG: hypothetical protein CMJ58_02900 [Planctomycetaceae bacterium]|nr:hypothetical protein [Planctomycetaceae bacterium]